MMNSRRLWCPRMVGAGLLVWTACAAAGEPARETRDISQPFSEVRLVGDVDLELSQGDAVSLVIEAPREELSTIQSEVKDGVLTLRRNESRNWVFWHWFHRHWKARVLLSTPAAERLVVDGSGSVHADAWTSHALELLVSGAGNVGIGRLTVTRLHCDLFGSGNVRIAGSAAHQRIRLAGSGAYRAPDLKSQAATVSISGSGDAELWVEQTLEARIAGSGDVRYYGAPTVTKSVSGPGSVTGLGERAGR